MSFPQMTELANNNLTQADFSGDWDTKPMFGKDDGFDDQIILGDKLFPMMYIYY